MGLCAGRVGAMPLLVLRQGVKRGLVGLQRLQLKTVIITLLQLCEAESGCRQGRRMCVCVRARACVVQCGVWLVGGVACLLAL